MRKKKVPDTLRGSQSGENWSIPRSGMPHVIAAESEPLSVHKIPLLEVQSAFVHFVRAGPGNEKNGMRYTSEAKVCGRKKKE